MLLFFTSLTFLYCLTGVLLIWLSVWQYRDFRNGIFKPKRFAWIFSSLALACLGFLTIHFYAPLAMKTYSNVDHWFLRQDGYLLKKQLVLGQSDTSNNSKAAFNIFQWKPSNKGFLLTAPYSEEPAYLSEGNIFKIISPVFEAMGQTLQITLAGKQLQVQQVDDDLIRLSFGEKNIDRRLTIKKGIQLWDLFKDQPDYLEQVVVNDDWVSAVLQQVYLVRDDVSRKDYGKLCYFISGKLISQGAKVVYNQKAISSSDLAFQKQLDPEKTFAWGIGFMDNNRNQLRLTLNHNLQPVLQYRYPLSFPLSPSDKEQTTERPLTKFLISQHQQIANIPGVLIEGFLFPGPGGNMQQGFAPQVLQYKNDAADKGLGMTIAPLAHPNLSTAPVDDQFSLPALSNDFDYLFSLQNTFHWKFDAVTLPPMIWQLLIFGSLLFFVLMVLWQNAKAATGLQRFVLSILAAIVLVMLTTRYFLYWRYKSFPPFEGMDLPSVQQLNSISNFGIVVAATVILGLLFAGNALTNLRFKLFKRKPFSFASADWLRIENLKQKVPFLKNFPASFIFLGAWFLFLAVMLAWSVFSGFDSGVSRHIAVILLAGYFIFLYQSYCHSPLATAAESRWWKLNTHRRGEMLVNNPVKIFLSVSLLGAFVFIDIGFAIVFLNFLLFHEAFLCINYGIAGLSAGSNKNARWMTLLGALYMLLFVLNLLFAPFVFKLILDLSQFWYLIGYAVFGAVMAYALTRLLLNASGRQRRGVFAAVVIMVVGLGWLFLPKEKIIEKASMTRYRIDVLTLSPQEAIASAYADGKNQIPVIRAAQNQWFINTFIDKDNNAHALRWGFQMLPHAPQNKGAKYNAQATDLVASRFIVAEHGQWAILLYVCLLLLPAILLSSFYKLYPDFTNRVNTHYAPVTTGFAVLNYLVIAALLVVLAATGRYIFFGQDLPFGSILSKQSILFPLVLVAIVVLLFAKVPVERFAHSKKWVPGAVVFALLLVLLFAVRPSYNRQKEFSVDGLAGGMELFVEQNLQPIFDHFDGLAQTSRLSIREKDKMFTDSLRNWINDFSRAGAHPFFIQEAKAYANSGFATHRDQRKLLFLDLRHQRPKLSVNQQYFRIEAPPHLQNMWRGNVLGDTAIVNIDVYDGQLRNIIHHALLPGEETEGMRKAGNGILSWLATDNGFEVSYANQSSAAVNWRQGKEQGKIGAGQQMLLAGNASTEFWSDDHADKLSVSLSADYFMRNYFVNGSRFYYYPLGKEFIWARNFAEAISMDYAGAGLWEKDAVVSLNYRWNDSLGQMISNMLQQQAEFPKGASYGITVVDAKGRVLAMADHIKGLEKIDPNNKNAFQRWMLDEKGQMAASDWRNHLGNVNLLRLNPGPGSTLKPIVFAALASQMNLNWSAFSTTGFSEKQTLYGGMRVPEYDFELNNGTIQQASEYLRLSDNYYHSNLLLLGSYRKQPLGQLLQEKFGPRPTGPGLHWPYFTYEGNTYYLNGFNKWPEYENGAANFGSDSSFLSIGLAGNFNISNNPRIPSASMVSSSASLPLKAAAVSGFVLPEWSLWDQKALQVDHRVPYNLFLHSFKGHAIGSSQVLISPLGMAHSMGRLVSQNKNYQLSFDAQPQIPDFAAFDVDPSIPYNQYTDLLRLQVFKGMKDVMTRGTAAGLGKALPQGTPYFYFGKTGTTGDDRLKMKSKLFSLIISAKDLSSPDHIFRDNDFVIVYFTAQNGPEKQQDQFQLAVVKYLEQSAAFRRLFQK